MLDESYLQYNIKHNILTAQVQFWIILDTNLKIIYL